MSLFAPPLISLFFFSAFAVAGLYAPACSATWRWSFNSLGQNACTVAAYMLSTCHGGSFTVDALPPGYHYAGPYKTQAADLCQCNTIAYSLLSACDGCQGSEWISWLDFSYNCTRVLPPSSFPNPIPAGTRLQHWALLDVTVENNWNQANAITAGDTPELGPGIILGPAGPSVASSVGGPSSIYPPSYPSSTWALPSYFPTSIPPFSFSDPTFSFPYPTFPYPIPSYPSTPGVGNSNTGAIAGGTVAGIAAISIVGVALFFYRKRQRSMAQSAPSVLAGDGQPGAYNPHRDVSQVPPRPISGQETVTSSLPGTSTSIPRPYNPEDPSTFPGYQAPPNPSFTSAQAPSSSSNTGIRNLYTVATPPSPEARKPEV